jgi:hypothetical protein
VASGRRAPPPRPRGRLRIDDHLDQLGAGEVAQRRVCRPLLSADAAGDRALVGLHDVAAAHEPDEASVVVLGDDRQAADVDGGHAPQGAEDRVLGGDREGPAGADVGRREPLDVRRLAMMSPVWSPAARPRSLRVTTPTRRSPSTTGKP